MPHFTAKMVALRLSQSSFTESDFPEGGVSLRSQLSPALTGCWGKDKTLTVDSSHLQPFILILQTLGSFPHSGLEKEREERGKRNEEKQKTRERADLNKSVNVIL